MQRPTRSSASPGFLTAISLMVQALWLIGVYSAMAADPAEPITPVPTSVPVDLSRARLGERLFHDVRLSGRQTHSCATCHPLNGGGMDGLPVARRPADDASIRNTPTIFNVSLNASFNWDGSTDSLEAHTTRLIPGLMDLKWPDLLARLRADSGYRTAFEASYPDGITQRNAVDAIVAFERTLLTPGAAFDRYLAGADDALGPRAQEGYRRFKEYGCASCHQGVNIGGNLYQRFGVFDSPDGIVPGNDLGRVLVTNLSRDREVFRVPSLRNVAVSAPYFHDGRARTLDEAVETMGRRQLGRVLNATDTAVIVEFLKALTGQYRGRYLTVGRDMAEPRRDVAK
jgi:cytochrome c peroxidase